MIFYSIEIKHNNEQVILNPIQCLKVTDDSNRIVVIYEIKYLVNNAVNQISHVNYYLSDGNTNKLRANMLFPFYCYHQRNSKSCINITGKYATNYKLLVKLSGVINVSLDKINNNILSKTKNQIHQKLNKTWAKSDRMLLNYLDLFDNVIDRIEPNDDIKKFNYTVDAYTGLISVVQRIENLVDLVIALYSEPLINVVSIEHYKPIPHEDYYYMGIDYFDFSHTFYNIGLTDEYEHHNNIIDKFLRQNLVDELHNLITILTRTKLFNASSVTLEPVEINKQQFNDTYAQICKENNINQSKKTNYATYFKISQSLLQIVKRKIDMNIHNYNLELCRINKTQDESSSITNLITKTNIIEKINELSKIKSMLNDKTLYRRENLDRNEETFLGKNILSWNGTCNKR